MKILKKRRLGMVFSLLLATLAGQQAFACTGGATVWISIQNNSSNTYHLYFAWNNMETPNIRGPGSSVENGVVLLPNSTLTNVFSGTDCAGDTNQVFISGLDGYTLNYNAGGGVSSSGSTEVQTLANPTCHPGGNTYNFTLIEPAGTDSQNNCTASGWQGGYSPICVSSATASNYDGLCDQPTITTTFVIPANFPAPRASPS